MAVKVAFWAVPRTGSQQEWPSCPSFVFRSLRSVSWVQPGRRRWQRSLCDEQTVVTARALCQVLERRQLGAHCPEETNKMSHRTNATATEGRPSAEGREVFPEEVASAETWRVAWSVLAS